MSITSEILVDAGSDRAPSLPLDEADLKRNPPSPASLGAGFEKQYLGSVRRIQAQSWLRFHLAQCLRGVVAQIDRMVVRL
jgi:hypothetical protein